MGLLHGAERTNKNNFTNSVQETPNFLVSAQPRQVLLFRSRAFRDSLLRFLLSSFPPCFKVLGFPMVFGFQFRRFWQSAARFSSFLITRLRAISAITRDFGDFLALPLCSFMSFVV